MTNSDYLLKATLKKLGEKLNQTFLEKIEDATTAAQEVPEIIKKEFQILRDEIITEAKKMETMNNKSTHENESNKQPNITEQALIEINAIKNQLEILNKKLDS
ncbi:MAG: hypothetical protein CMK49_01970 [Prochlorococcus sp. SP3034]|nr:hypothetical protein [Prochlorococcus sp. SP3034]|tara:strand:+ start:173 stop:481 length:309 start_codon:yes stop_codon:yes gene_type:complete